MDSIGLSFPDLAVYPEQDILFADIGQTLQVCSKSLYVFTISLECCSQFWLLQDTSVPATCEHLAPITPIISQV